MDTIRDLLNIGGSSAPAIFNENGTHLTHEQLRHKVDELEQQLRTLGIGRGDRVAIAMPNGPEMALVFLAAVSAGCSAPLNPKYREAEFRFFLDDLRAKTLIVGESGNSDAEVVAGPETLIVAAVGEMGSLDLELRSGVPAEEASETYVTLGPDDVALVLHTSGTTSRPKVVPLRQRNVASSALNIARSLSLTPDDRSLNVMPLFHIHGLVAALLAPLSAGGSVVCTPGFDALRFHRWLAELTPTYYSAVPTMHQMVLGRTRAPVETSLRFIRSSSASLPGAVLDSLQAVFSVPVVEAYGMTEASHQMASNPLPPSVTKPGSVGLPTGTEIVVLGPDGKPHTPGERGEVAVRGLAIVDGYENNDEANTAAFTLDGWFRTGDEGYLDDDGYLHLTGRIKEQINRGGEKVSPIEVDEVLTRHPAVSQAVTFALPHPVLGEDVAAAIVLTEGQHLDTRELRQFASKHLASFKVPRQIHIVEEIPKGPTGKVQRIGLATALSLDSAITQGQRGCGADT